MPDSSEIDRGLRSRITASNARFSGVSKRSRASTELKLGDAASFGAGFSPRATASISAFRSSWL
jgi:hypothetical protein